MGWNTTVVVMNDALSAIRDDPQFGERLYRAVLAIQRGKPVDVAAHANGGIHCNAATVIETHHADHTVYVKVGQNCGVPFTSEEAELFNAASRRAAKKAARAATPE